MPQNQTDEAELVSVTPNPVPVNVKGSSSVTVTLRNIGTSTWSAEKADVCDYVNFPKPYERPPVPVFAP
jgi:hypothetical protein